MRFKLYRTTKGSKAILDESYDKPELCTKAQVEAWCKHIVGWFNSTLREGERPRIYVRCEIIGESVAKGEHNWRKKNIMTLPGTNFRGSFDLMKCETCHAVARRYGLNFIVMQKGFTSKKYKQCPGAA